MGIVSLFIQQNIDSLAKSASKVSKLRPKCYFQFLEANSNSSFEHIILCKSLDLTLQCLMIKHHIRLSHSPVCSTSLITPHNHLQIQQLILTETLIIYFHRMTTITPKPLETISALWPHENKQNTSKKYFNC